MLAARGCATEELHLLHPPDTEGGIDVWLRKVDAQTQATLKSLVIDAIKSGDKDMAEELVKTYPAQVCALVLHLNWTNESVRALQKAKTEPNGMISANNRNVYVVKELAAMLSVLVEIEPHQRFAVQNLIIIQMHLRDVFRTLTERKVVGETDFEWTKTARLEIEKDTQGVLVACAGAEVLYGYDYEGLSQRAVITPLTDRCTISFLHALIACVGGAFVGPADVGKCSAVKEISKLVGRCVMTFNCHQHLSLAYLERCFSGLPACGCFGCFDEFDRLTYRIMSACVQQLSKLLSQIRVRRNSTQFSDTIKQADLTSALDIRLGIFLTFSNDSGSCRQDVRNLENLRRLYRTFAMNKIDTELVASVQLAAEGFQQHAKMAKKLKTVYHFTTLQLAGSKRMSSLGVRNILSVVKIASNLRTQSERNHEQPNEMECIVHALLAVNAPRMSATEKGIFNAIVSDIFHPGLAVDSKAASQELTDAITMWLRKQKMDKHVTWMEKILQLHAIMELNHGVMVLGGAALGKSAMISTLQQALQHLAPNNHKYSLQKMNPKSQSVQQMFGWRETAPEQWHDGTFSFLWRRARIQPDMSTWIVLDGPIDPIWAENLNTLLDDQKLLTLANGDRIAMQSNARVIFESDKADHASPATMARTGVVWVPSTALPWRSYVNNWIEGRGSEERVILRSLFDRYMDQLLHFQKMQCSPVVQTPTIYVPWMLTRMFDSASKFMDFRWDASGEVFLEKIFIFCMCWSFGGLLENMDRVKLSQFMYTLTDLLPVMKNDVTLFDFYPDDNVLDWEHWRTRIPEWKCELTSVV